MSDTLLPIWPTKDLNDAWFKNHEELAIKNLYESYIAFIEHKDVFGGVHFTNILTFAFSLNKKMLLNLENHHFDTLFDYYDNQHNNKWSSEILIALALNNNTQNINLRPDQIERVIASTDINQCVNSGELKHPMTPLAAIFSNNTKQNLNFSKTTILEIMEKTDYQSERYYSLGIINEALKFNKSSQLNFTEREWEFLIKNAKLSSSKNENSYHHCVLTLFASLPKGDLNLTFSQIDYIAVDSGLNVREVEQLKTDNDKLNFMLSLLNSNQSMNDYYGEQVLKGYHIYKEEKLKQFAIKDEKELLSKILPITHDNTNLIAKPGLRNKI